MRVDEALRLIPELDELRPLVRALVAASVPDPERAWTGSGELATFGGRLLADPGMGAGAGSGTGSAAGGWPEVARAEAERRRALLASVGGAVAEARAGRMDAAVARLTEAARRELEASSWATAEGLALSAHRAASEAGLTAATAAALRWAAVAARARGDLDAASDRYERAARHAADVGDLALAITASIGRGNVAVDRSRWDEAERWYGQALERMEAAGERRPERWHVAQNLAIVARERGDPAAARRWLETAEREARAQGDPDAELDVNNGWGQLLMAEGDLAGAELRFRRARAAARTPLARAVVAVNLAECLLARGRLLEAVELGREAEAVAIVEDVPGRLPEVYRLLGAAAGEQGAEDALVFFERALELVRELGLPAVEEARTLEAYGRWRARHGEPAEAARLLRAAAARWADAGMSHREDELRRAAGRLEPDTTDAPEGESS
jgi:tetratricopeptide (TPR) repeat protein